MMRDDVSGVFPCRSVSQHSTVTHCRNKNLTTAKLHLPIISRPGSEVSQSRIHTSKVSKETFFHTQTRLVHFSPRSNCRARLSIAHFSPDRSTHRSPRDPSRSLCQGSSHVPPSLGSLLPCLCHTIPPAFARELFGLPEVLNTLLQMYPPDIQHTPKETSEYKRALNFLLRT